jgi:glycosyltransferase involved in cell wall biosynthesis
LSAGARQIEPDRVTERANPDRVAILTQQVSPYHAARYRGARKELPDVRVFSILNSGDFREFLAKEEDVRDVVRICEGEESYRAAISSGALWTRLFAEFDAYRPAVVVVAGWSFPESLAAIAWSRSHGARAVVMSESQPHDAPRTAWREWLKARVVSACDAALVAAPPHRDYVVRLGIPVERVFFGYDAVDNGHFAKGADVARARDAGLRKELGLPRRYLLASGRFMEKKNFPRLVEAFAEALKRVDTGHDLVILGDGAERAAIEAAAARHGVSARVHLPGFRGYEVLPSIYGLAEGFLHVPLAEQWGLVVNEGAASGLPLVVSKPCGAAALMLEPGVNGMLVEPTSTAEIAKAIEWLMKLTPEERRVLGSASRRIVSEWGPERFGSGLRAACEAALGCPARTLGMFDRVLLRALARMYISKVR